MATELTPKERPEAHELLKKLRLLAKTLRSFLDTEDFTYFTESVKIHQEIRGIPIYQHLSGHLDLDNNMEQLQKIYETGGANMDDMTFGRMLDQVVYTIVRANIVSTGLEFKLKRMRKG
ncbi:hypothetical protein CSUB_C1484 [Candidatus Caldarchaeum subterraneum]|uniref:Uncharacterized protein n=1 Tax=Caldiarchaeum subterraneum TaxID=311458 RepID=E6N8K5_CALS0|nr:hypothetical protein HGMM_F30C12C42 [Candidatus Caldarchaeum subterraneum]BAJ48630.1 hypothetical protein HGMM_F12C01C04 [Candidatus Caldarchaeum subterraneum]BAJ49681.1 hypothetical protein HGMM_F21D07C31 [Candidatus Caldarchaeum subterraneum]BAJ51335.1 hypothetical protein CSUB_C1484 [Candidatus Caldarchaeum subterraneum]